MLDIIVYDRIEQKNEIERENLVRMSPQQALEHTLNMMDFMAKFRATNPTDDSAIDWIVLEIEQSNIK